MPDQEWIKTLEDGRRVKFIYQELPEDGAFITAQVAGNEVVYSVVLTNARNPLGREDVEAVREVVTTHAFSPPNTDSSENPIETTGKLLIQRAT